MSTRSNAEADSNTVLIVEDEYFIAMEVKRALTEGGFAVLGPVSTVDDALRIINDQRPFAAVLDVTLENEMVTPVANLLTSMKVPFVLTSALHESELERHPTLRDVPTLGKPTDLGRLISALRSL